MAAGPPKINEDNTNRPTKRKKNYAFAFAISATVATAIGACLFVLFAENIPLSREMLERLNFVGAFVAGVANLIAIIWLSATLSQQRYDLRAQIEELSMQRAAISMMSRTTRSQFLIYAYGQLSARLAYNARYIVMLVKSEELTKAVDREFFVGDHDKYFRLILEDSEIQHSLLEHIQKKSAAVMFYVSNYLRSSEDLRVAMNSVEAEATISILVNSSPLMGVRDLFNSMISRASQ